MYQADHRVNMEGTLCRHKNMNKSLLSWTVEQKLKLDEFWSEQQCIFHLSLHFYHNGVDRGKKWAEIATAPKSLVSAKYANC